MIYEIENSYSSKIASFKRRCLNGNSHSYDTHLKKFEKYILTKSL